jgi:hypothetical protein
MPLPESGKFTVRIDFAQLPWKGSSPRYAEAVDAGGHTLRRVSLTTQNGAVVLDCDPGVFAWHFQ